MSDFVLTPAREKELEKIAQSLSDKAFKDLYGKDWKSVKMATAMNILKKKHGFKTEEAMKFKQLREKYRSKFPASLVAAAVKIALDMSGNMTGAYKKIEAMKRGLGDDPIVKDALRQANESVQEGIRDPKWKALIRKHKRHIDNFVKRNKDLPKNVEDDLYKWAFDNGEIKTDDPDEFDDFLDRELSEGTMAIGIFDNNPAKKKKAIAGMQKLLKGKQNVKVGSPEGQKIGRELDAKYLSDDLLADDFDDSSNKNMTISQLLKKHEKRLGLNFKEEVEEALSPKEKAKRLELIRKAVEKLNAKQDAKAKKDALAAIKAME